MLCVTGTLTLGGGGGGGGLIWLWFTYFEAEVVIILVVATSLACVPAWSTRLCLCIALWMVTGLVCMDPPVLVMLFTPWVSWTLLCDKWCNHFTKVPLVSLACVNCWTCNCRVPHAGLDFTVHVC